MLKRSRRIVGLTFHWLLAASTGGFGCGTATDEVFDSRTSAVVTRTDDPDCPPGIPCDEWPAAYAVTNPMTGAYGNYDLADRESDGLDIRYIVIHTTEGSYDSTLTVFQNPSYAASAHYLVRSRDGNLAKLISPSHVAWHAGNWYFNMHSVGIEHEAYSPLGQPFMTDKLYATSAALVRFLAARYHVPLDREHIIGHDEVPGLSIAKTPGMHWDPGPYWDWDRFMRLVRTKGGEPVGDRSDDGLDITGPVRIQPDYTSNHPTVTYCYTATDCHEAPRQSENFLYLRQAPSDTAPLIVNPYLSGTPGDRMNNWANKAGTGRLYYRIDRSGDWDAIFFSGQVAWFKNPGRSATRIPLLGSGQSIIRPKAKSGTIPVYGGGYPGDGAYKPPTTPQHLDKIYDMPEGQRYIAYGPVTGDYYWAKAWAATLPLSDHQVIKDSSPYYVVSFNHRLALVRAGDVTVERPRTSYGASAPSGPEFLLPSAKTAEPSVETSPDMPLADLKGMDF